jgi:hypothetical protein
MRITGIKLENWLIHRHLDARLSPLTLISGPNECGKTAIRYAVAFGVMNLLPPDIDKGERKKLITKGQKQGTVTLTYEGNGETVSCSRDVASGKGRGGAFPVSPDVVTTVIENCLDTALFCLEAPNVRRKTLLDVCRIVMTPAHLRDLLVRRGHILAEELPEALPEQWMLYCAEQASQARGAWKAVTGEVYGSEKGETWAAPAPEAPAVPIVQLEQDLAGLRRQQLALQSQLGAEQERRKTIKTREDQLARLRAKTATWDASEARLTAARADILKAEEIERKAAAALADLQAAGPKPLACTRCGTLHRLEGGVLVEDPDAVADQEPVSPAQRENLKAIHARAVAQVAAEKRRLEASMMEQAEIRAAENTIIELEAQAAEAPDDAKPIDLDKVAAGVDRLETVEIPEAMDRLAAARGAEKERERAKDNTRTAKEHHRSVKDWVALRDEVSPDGLPAELLKGALEKFNNHLIMLCGLFGWSPFTIGQDMEIIHRGGIPLPSESAQWKIDTILGLALAEVSEFRAVVIDRFDVLSVPDRKPALEAFYKMIKSKRIDSIIVIGTLTAPPAVPKDVSVHWLGEQLAVAA